MRNILVIVLFFILFVISGCAGGPSSVPTPPPVAVGDGGLVVETMNITSTQICEGSLMCATVFTMEIVITTTNGQKFNCIREVSMQMRGTGISTQCWPQPQ